MRILYITNMYPNEQRPFGGIFIKQEVERLQKNGLDVSVVLINGKKSKLEYVKSPFHIYKKLSDGDFDLINVQHSLLLPQTLFAKRLLNLRTPIIYTFHEGGVKGWHTKKNLVDAIFGSHKSKTAFVKYVDLILTRNAAIMDTDHNVSIVEIPSPVDTELFKPMSRSECRMQVGMETGNPIILFPAYRDRPEKNFSFLADVINDLNRERGLEIKIITGPIPHELMPIYYNACDVVCLPSLFEASPVAIREALACNRPIVASDVGDIRRAVDAVDGCFVTKGWNKNEFAECINRALGYKCTAGRSRIFEMGWDWKSSINKLISVFTELVEQRMKS